MQTLKVSLGHIHWWELLLELLCIALLLGKLYEDVV